MSRPLLRTEAVFEESEDSFCVRGNCVNTSSSTTTAAAAAIPRMPLLIFLSRIPCSDGLTKSSISGFSPSGTSQESAERLIFSSNLSSFIKSPSYSSNICLIFANARLSLDRIVFSFLCRILEISRLVYPANKCMEMIRRSSSDSLANACRT